MSDVSRRLDFAVVVAMVAMRVVQMTSDEVIDVVAVRHCFMPAIRSVAVSLVVSTAIVVRGADGGIRGIHCQSVFFDRAAFLMMEVTVMQVVGVTFVDDRGVSAGRTVIVFVTFVMVRHDIHLLLRKCVQFVRVGQCIQNQVGDVPIRERVIEVVAVTTTGQQSLAMEDAEPLGNGRELFADRRDDLGHAQFAIAKEFEDPKPRCIPHRPEQLCGAVQRSRRDHCVRMMVIARVTGRDRIVHTTLHSTIP